MKNQSTPCIFCKKVWDVQETQRYVYLEFKGVACRNHPGVMDLYNAQGKKDAKKPQQ
jgi:hypothetical protein